MKHDRLINMLIKSGRIKRLLLHRNSVLVIAVVLGMISGDLTEYTRDYTTLVLGVVMCFAFTSLDISYITPFRKAVKPFFYSIFLNYFLFSAVIIFFAWLILREQDLYTGFVLIAAAPVGLSVVPFTYMLKGNVNFAIVGVFSIFLSSVLIAPLMAGLFLGEVEINILELFITMAKLVLIPLFVSRLLAFKGILSTVEKVRGPAVNWGFAFVIFTVVGMNREVFFTEHFILLRIILVLFIGIFVLAWVYEKGMSGFINNRDDMIAHVLILTTKSSGFSAVTAMNLYGERAAVPSAVLSIMVILFLFYKSFKFSNLTKSL